MDEKSYNAILEYLETSYSGAKMLDDIECMCRLSRAIAAFEADPEEEIYRRLQRAVLQQIEVNWNLLLIKESLLTKRASFSMI